LQRETEESERHALKITYNLWDKATDERVNDEDALSILEDMVYPHVDIDGIDYVEDAALEGLNLDAGELEEIKHLMEKLTRRVVVAS